MGENKLSEGGESRAQFGWGTVPAGQQTRRGSWQRDLTTVPRCHLVPYSLASSFMLPRGGLQLNGEQRVQLMQQGTTREVCVPGICSAALASSKVTVCQVLLSLRREALSRGVREREATLAHSTWPQERGQRDQKAARLAI